MAAARAIWRGAIRFRNVDVPVRLYAAVQDRGVHFRLLHARDRTPVRQHMVNPSNGEEVPSDRVRRGLQVEPGVFVVLDDADLASAEPKPSRDIAVKRFVTLDAIGPAWFEWPYYVGPDKGGDAAYAALVAALSRRRRQGIARWVMRNREYVGALRSERGALVLVTLRHADEVVPAEELASPAGRDLDKKELALADQLVSALAGHFDPAAYRDEYRDRVLEFVERKARGRRVKLPRVARKRATPSLAGALRASLAQAGRKVAHG
jgi:DNA end-binding protein Ku